MKIFLSTHGAMASGMMSSIKLLCGKTQNLTTFDAYLNPEILVSEQIELFLKSCLQEEKKILISDILGGSVNHDMMQFISQPNTYIITGVNLPLLLELVLRSDEEMSGEEIDGIIESSKAMLKRIAAPELSVEEEDFFEEE